MLERSVRKREGGGERESGEERERGGRRERERYEHTNK